MKMQLKRVMLIRILVAMCFVSSAAVPFQETSAQGSERQVALAFEQQGRTDEAENAWKSIAARDPRNAEAFAHLGLLEARQEHYKDAILDYRKALALDPSFPNLRVNLGLSYFKAGELKETVQIYEPMLKAMPSSSPQRARIVALTGLAHYGLGNYAAAAPYLKESVASDPTNLEFRLMHAHSCLWTKQFDCVLDEYKEIITINPNAAEAYMLAGEAYDELKDDTHALAQFQAAVKADPKTPDVHFGYGYLLWRLRRFDEAEAEFKAELANNPDHAQALAYLGDIEVHLEHPEQAEPYLERSIKLDPSLALAHLDLGTVYEGQGRKADATREFEISSRLNPNDQNAHWRLARLYRQLGRKEDADAEIEKTRNLQKVQDEPLINKLNKSSSPPDSSPAKATVN